MKPFVAAGAALILSASLASAEPGLTAAFACGGQAFAILPAADGGYDLARYENGGRRLVLARIPSSDAPNAPSLCREIAEACAADPILRVAQLRQPAAACVIGLVDLAGLD